MATNKLAYLELPTTEVKVLKNFYGPLFGWEFEDFGDNYTAFYHPQAGLDGGFNAVAQDKTKAPLAIIETDAIETMEAKVEAAGGTITMHTFSYPGGRRFHFTDPSGNELAIMQLDSCVSLRTGP